MVSDRKKQRSPGSGVAPCYFVTFMPRKAHVVITIKLPQSKEVDDQLEEAGIDTLTYERHWRQYRVRIDEAVDDK